MWIKIKCLFLDKTLYSLKIGYTHLVLQYLLLGVKLTNAYLCLPFQIQNKLKLSFFSPLAKLWFILENFNIWRNSWKIITYKNQFSFLFKQSFLSILWQLKNIQKCDLTFCFFKTSQCDQIWRFVTINAWSHWDQHEKLDMIDRVYFIKSVDASTESNLSR